MKNKILLSAFSARKGFGSEPGLGWHTAVNLSRYFDVVLVTDAANASYLTDLPETVEVVLIPFKGDQAIFWRQGDWRFYYYYRIWQRDAFKKLSSRIGNKEFFVIHHLNVIGFRELGDWYLQDTTPVVYGPLGGFGWASPRLMYASGANTTAVLKELIKIVLNLFCYMIPRVRSAIANAAYVFAATPEAFSELRRWFPISKSHVEFFPETGVEEIGSLGGLKDTCDRSIDVLFCGKPADRKGFGLFLDVLAGFGADSAIASVVVGFSEADLNRRQQERLRKLNIKVKFLGKVARSEVLKIMEDSKVLLFPSLHEGTSHAAMEAMSLGVKLLSFNINSHGYLVKEYGLGYVVDPCASYCELVNELQKQLKALVASTTFDREAVGRFRVANSWQGKCERYAGLYRSKFV